MYSVIFEGFPTLAHAKEFAAWFEGQGENDAVYWFEANSPDGSGESPMAELVPDIVDEEQKTLTTQITFR